MQADNGVSRKDLSTTRRTFLLSLKIKLSGVRHKSGENISSQHENAAAHFFRSSLLRVVSTLVLFLDTEASEPHTRACLYCHAVMKYMIFAGV